MGHEEVPCGSGLRTGDPGDTADGAGNYGRPASQVRITGKNWGLPEPQMSISFPEIQYSRLGKAGKEGLCVMWVFKGLWDFNAGIKSLLLSLYNF